MKQKQIETGVLHRFISFTPQKEEVQEDSRMIPLAFSSENPVLREFGYEILDHSPESINLQRQEVGIPLLLDHDNTKQIGIVEKISIDQDKVGRALVRFGKSQKAEESYQDVLDGIKRGVSVGYRIHSMEVESSENPDFQTYRATSWEPLEISLVSVPADPEVGLYREENQKLFKTTVVNRNIEEKENIMEEKRVDVVSEPQVDVDKIKNDVRAQEQKRVSAILAEGKEHGHDALASRAISEGKSLAEFRTDLLAELKNNKKPTVELTPKEEQRYSLLNAISAAQNQDWSKAGFEREISKEIENKTGKSARGFFVPEQGWSVRTVKNVTGSSGAGANTVGEEYRPGNFIEALVSESILGRVGATIWQGLQGDVVVPKMSASTSAAFVAEAGSAGNNEPTYAQLTLSSKDLANYVAISRSMLINSNPSVEETIRRNMVRVFAAAVDNAALDGSGSGANPTGILNTSGIGDVESSGTSGNANLTWGNCVDIIKEVSVDNALMGSLHWVTHPAVVAKLMQTVRVSSTDSQFIMNDPDSLVGYNLVQTTQMPSSSPYSLLFGNFQDLVVGFFSGLDILVNPYSSATTGLTNIHFYQSLDIGVMHAESFSAAQDVTVT